jgi:hypothetical protein
MRRSVERRETVDCDECMHMPSNWSVSAPSRSRASGLLAGDPYLKSILDAHDIWVLKLHKERWRVFRQFCSYQSPLLWAATVSVVLGLWLIVSS